TFFATYYAVLNALALVVQLAVAGPLVRRLGVTAAMLVFPVLLFGGAIAIVVAGASLALVLATKGTDGALRHSLHRVTSELLFLPVGADTGERYRPVIDPVLARGVQAIVAALILAAAALGGGGPRVLAAAVAALALGWLVVAVGLRTPYLGLFRQAL